MSMSMWYPVGIMRATRLRGPSHPGPMPGSDGRPRQAAWPAKTLAAILLGGCGGGDAATGPGATGTLEVRATTSGPVPAESYTVRVGSGTHALLPNGVVSVPSLPPGPVVVTLEAVSAGCGAGGENPRTVEVPAGDIAVTEFAVQCVPGATHVLGQPAAPPTTSQVGPAGGQVTATAADGTQFTLLVPPGALQQTVAIQVTPATFTGLTATVERFRGGVLLEPSGLTFQHPATLSITPPGGLGEYGDLVGFVFDEGGTPSWQLPRLNETGTSFLLSVPHFSGGGHAQASPNAWGPLLEALGILPVVVPAPNATIKISRAGSGNERVPLCVTVLQNHPSGGPTTPWVGAPVSFLSLDGPVVPWLSGERHTTNVNGEACAYAFVPASSLFPPGAWVMAKAAVFHGSPFETPARPAAAVVDEHFPFDVVLEAPPPGVTSDQPFTLCARVANQQDTSRVVADYLVGFEALSFQPQFGFSSATTGADGRACISPVLELPDGQGEGEVEVTLRASISSLDLSVTPQDTAFDPSMYVALLSERVVTARLIPLSISIEAPGNMLVGTSADVCGELYRDALPLNGKDVFFRIEGGPGRFSEGSTDGRLSAASTGSAGPGRGCVQYDAPEDNDEETVIFQAFASVRGGGEISARFFTGIVDPRPRLTVTATPSTLSEAGAQGQVCAELWNTNEDRPVAGASLTFALDGPGSLSVAEGVPVTSDANGRACVTFTAPDPIPDGETTARIAVKATGTLWEGTIERSVEIQLKEQERLLSVTANPATLTEGGATSQICAFVRTAQSAAPVAGALVRFSLDGLGSLAAAGLAIPTGGDGLACTTYTAPAELPEGASEVTIQAEAEISSTPPLQAATVVTLSKEEVQAGVFNIEWWSDYFTITNNATNQSRQARIDGQVHVLPSGGITTLSLEATARFGGELGFGAGDVVCYFEDNFTFDEVRELRWIGDRVEISMAGVKESRTWCDDGTSSGITTEPVTFDPDPPCVTQKQANGAYFCEISESEVLPRPNVNIEEIHGRIRVAPVQ